MSNGNLKEWGPSPDSIGQKNQILVWRIEKMTPIRQTDPKTFGQFHSGDSYIILHTIEPQKKMNLFFWLGKDSTADEKGCAAYKTVELDTLLNDVPVQYRECQGHESGLFMSLFKSVGGIRYLDGGVESAFNKVEPQKYVTKLLHVKGRRNCRVIEVQPVHYSSMNEGDAFILDQGLSIYIWCGKECNKYERQKALEVGRMIRSERGGRPKVIEYQESVTQSEKRQFWKDLGLGAEPAQGKIKSADEGGSDELCEKVNGEKTKVYWMRGEKVQEIEEVKCVKVPFERKVREVWMDVKVPFERKVLKSDGVYLLDTGSEQPGIFVWNGKNAASNLKKKSMIIVSDWLKKQKRPEHTGVARMDESRETSLFKTFFNQFDKPDSLPCQNLDNFQQSQSTTAKTRASEVSISDMQKGQQGAQRRNSQIASQKFYQRDKSRESVTIWRVEKFQPIEVSREYYGEFYQGDSYLIEYIYRKEGSKNSNAQIEEAIIYYWQGLSSTADEKGASALLAVKFDKDHFNGAATQIRVTQGKEPSNFLALFGGKMIIHKGGFESGFKKISSLSGGNHNHGSNSNTNSHVSDAEIQQYPKMYHLRGTIPSEVKAQQVDVVAKNLNSNDAFVIMKSVSEAIIWYGKGASEEERDLAKNLVQRLRMSQSKFSNNGLNGKSFRSNIGVPQFETKFIEEGKESKSQVPDFWNILGGKTDYASSPCLQDPGFEPRLFQVSNATGALRAEEIFDFSQEDLIDEDVMLLDTKHTVYVWIGNLANKEEKEQGNKIAEEYVSTSTDGRSYKDTPIVVVKAGYEPLLFKCHFVGWDESISQQQQNGGTGFQDYYALKQEQLKEEELKKKKIVEETAIKNSSMRKSSLKDMEDKRRKEQEERKKREKAETRKQLKSVLKKTSDGINISSTHDSTVSSDIVSTKSSSNPSIVAQIKANKAAKVQQQVTEADPVTVNQETTQVPDTTVAANQNLSSNSESKYVVKEHPAPAHTTSTKPTTSTKKPKKRVFLCCVLGSSDSGSETNSKDDNHINTSKSETEKWLPITTVANPNQGNANSKDIESPEDDGINADTMGGHGNGVGIVQSQVKKIDGGSAGKSKKVKEESSKYSAPPLPLNPVNGKPYADPRKVQYTFNQLSNVAKRPNDVCPTAKEQYLNDKEFVEVFGMSKKEFYNSTPVWKQNEVKKKKGLF